MPWDSLRLRSAQPLLFSKELENPCSHSIQRQVWPCTRLDDFADHFEEILQSIAIQAMLVSPLHWERSAPKVNMFFWEKSTKNEELVPWGAVSCRITLCSMRAALSWQRQSESLQEIQRHFKTLCLAKNSAHISTLGMRSLGFAPGPKFQTSTMPWAWYPLFEKQKHWAFEFGFDDLWSLCIFFVLLCIFTSRIFFVQLAATWHWSGVTLVDYWEWIIILAASPWRDLLRNLPRLLNIIWL